MSRYSNLVDTYARLFYGDTPTPEQYNEIKTRIARNAELPKNIASMRGVVSRMKPESEILSELGDFQSAFRTAVQEEMEMGLASAERLRTLEYALKSPTMNLGIISNSEVRRQLEGQWQDIAQRTRNFSAIWITSCFCSIR